MNEAPNRCDLLVRNGVLLTADERNTVLRNGSMAIDGGRIAAVGSDADLAGKWVADAVRNVQGAVVHPGFIDAHIHISQYTARTALPAMARTSRAGAADITMGHWKSHLRPEDEHASAMLAILDMIKSGYTGFVDPGTVLDTSAVAAAAEAADVRAWLTDAYVADRTDYLEARIPAFFGGSFKQYWPRNFDEAASRIGGELFRNNQSDALVRGFVGLYGEGSDSTQLHRSALEIAREHGVQFQKHLGYSPNLMRDLNREACGSVLRQLSEDDLLSSGVSLTHLNLLSEDEVKILVASGVKIVWCPYGQLAMIGAESARPRVSTAVRAGVSVALGTDIARAFNFDDLGKLAWSSGQAAGGLVSGEDIFLMRTRGAAASIGAAEELGGLEAGKRADFVIRRPEVSEDLGHDVFQELAVIAGRDAVQDVYVAGRAVLQDGDPVHLDSGDVLARARDSVRYLGSKTGLTA